MIIDEIGKLYNTLLKIEETGVKPELVPEIKAQREKGLDDQEIIRAMIIQISEILPGIQYAVLGCSMAAPGQSKKSLSDYANGLYQRINNVIVFFSVTLMMSVSSYNREIVSAIVRLSGLSAIMAELNFIKDYW